jgi:hypothetical protein
MSNYAITPEIRNFPGKKKYGKGFYLSLLLINTYLLARKNF